MRTKLLPLALAIHALAACSLSAPAVDSVLDPSAASATIASDDPNLPLDQRAVALQSQLDQLCASALAALHAKPDDLDLAMSASRLLFAAADLRLQQGTLAAIVREPSADLEAVLAADDDVADATRDAILSLATEGLTLAERVAAARPDDVAAQLHVGLHLSLVAWANGPARSLFAGFGPRIVAAIDRAVALDETFEHGAPLRLSGRFRGKAPWPYGDLALARTSLTRAVELSPSPVNQLFLGDVLHADRDRNAARLAWRAATTAVADDECRWSAPLLQELARLRLAADAAR